MEKLRIIPITRKEAHAFIEEHHRHHGRVAGHRFALGAALGDTVVGIAMVGRPVSRIRDDGLTAEVTRLCTDGTKNVASFLYGASARAAFALGYHRIGTYILKEETGVSLKAAGWRLIGDGSWDRPSRPRVDLHPTQGKLLFERSADDGWLPALNPIPSILLAARRRVSGT